MQLKNIRFPGFVFGQSGVQGFFGEPGEYRHHFWYRLLFFWGFSFKGMVFVAKTITWFERIYPKSSNTELRGGYKLKRFLPKSIWVSLKSFREGYMVNAVGLANPGAPVMLTEYKKWQKRTDAFQISFMPMGKTLEEKIEQTTNFCKVLLSVMNPKKHTYAIQLNDSCPNTGNEHGQKLEEIKTILLVFKDLLPNIDIIPKFDLTVTPQMVSALKDYCSAFCIANSLEVGKKTDYAIFDWEKLFKNGDSPLLRHFDGKFKGGLSGKPLFPFLFYWLTEMQAHDRTVKIIAGGGIMTKKDILKLSKFSIVHGIALGSVAILRPWRLQSLIKYGNKIFSNRKINR